MKFSHMRKFIRFASREAYWSFQKLKSMDLWVIQRFSRDGEGNTSQAENEVTRQSIGIFSKLTAQALIITNIKAWCEGTEYKNLIERKKDLLELAEQALQKGSLGLEFDEYLCGEYFLIDKITTTETLWRKKRDLVFHETFQIKDFVKDKEAQRKARLAELQNMLDEQSVDSPDWTLVEKIVRLKHGRDEDDDDSD